METTTIQVAEATADELHDRKRRGESYDDVIRRVLAAEQADAVIAGAIEADQEADADGGVPVECHSCGYSWEYTGNAGRATCPSCSLKTDVD